MPAPADMSRMEEFDSIEAFPALEEKVFFDRIRRAGRRLENVTQANWRIYDPSSFQDGALFTHISTGNAHSPTSILFSKFSGLITTGRFGSAPYTYSSEEILSFIHVLESDYGFSFASPSLLNCNYSGPFTRYKIGTWYQRYFCAVYWSAGKSHEGLLKWP
jgi:hypothetical protein